MVVNEKIMLKTGTTREGHILLIHHIDACVRATMPRPALQYDEVETKYSQYGDVCAEEGQFFSKIKNTKTRAYECTQ